MNRFLVSAAAMALMAAPAFAQNDEHHDDHNGGTPHAMTTGHPDRNPQHGPANGGAMGGPHPSNGPAMAGPPNSGNTTTTHTTAHPEYQHGAGNNNNNSAMHGPNNNNNGMHGPSGQMGGPHVANFNSYHRNFTATRRYHASAPYRRPPGWYSHRWTFGERLQPAFFVRDYWIDDYFDFGLVAPPYGTVWVRYGSDALLIDEASGEVVQVVYGVYY